ncbi:adenosyl-homocysteine hydrolase [Tanacetum coccineum]
MMMGTMIHIHCVTATSTNALAAADKRVTVGKQVGIDHPCGQSSDFGWMETVGSSIETNESALVWQYRDANSGFGFVHAKEMLDHRVSWQTNLLLSKVSNISLNSNLRIPALKRSTIQLCRPDMKNMVTQNEAFQQGRLSDYANVELSPPAGVLNYGQGTRRKPSSTRTRVYLLPKHLDEKVVALHLEKLGAKLTKLTQDQSHYLSIPIEGP